MNKVAGAIALTWLAGNAYAGGMMDVVMPDHVLTVIGLGFGVLPDYLGSDDNTWGIAPYFHQMSKALDLNLGAGTTTTSASMQPTSAPRGCLSTALTVAGTRTS